MRISALNFCLIAGCLSAATTVASAQEVVHALEGTAKNVNQKAGIIYVSNDDGRTFAPVSVPVRGRQVLQDLLTASSWKVFWGHTIDETTNAGQTWHSVVSNVDITSLYSPQSGLPTAVDFLNAKVGWLTSSTLWRTVDGGATWTRLRIPTLAS